MTEQNNDAQASALIAALAPKLAEALLPALQKQVEDQIQGVVKKNDELLEKLAKSTDAPDLSKILDAAEQQLQERLKGGTFNPTDATAPLTITKADARDVRKYRAARDEAEKRGVSLQIQGRPE